MNSSSKKILAGITSAIILSGGIVSAPVFAAKTSVSVNVEVEQNRIEWDEGFVYAIGMSRRDERGVAMEREAAILSAQRHLVGTVQGARIDSETTMRDLILGVDEVNRKITGVIRGAQIIDEHPLDGGGYYVKMSVPIYGVESIAEAIVPALVPETPKPFETVENPSVSRAEVREVQSAEYTGVIVNASGLGVEQTFSPVIYDTQGRAVYGIENLESEKVIASGMVSYSENTSDGAAVQRAGDNPLIVRAVEVRGGANSANKVNAVISVEDADKILLANEKTHMLDNCAVVFVK